MFDVGPLCWLLHITTSGSAYCFMALNTLMAFRDTERSTAKGDLKDSRWVRDV